MGHEKTTRVLILVILSLLVGTELLLNVQSQRGSMLSLRTAESHSIRPRNSTSTTIQASLQSAGDATNLQPRRSSPPYRLVVVGAARDNQKYLQRLKQVIYNVSQVDTMVAVDGNQQNQPQTAPRVPFFSIEKLVFFENDSNDGTRQELESWDSSEPFAGKVTVLPEKSTLPSTFSRVTSIRTERLATARNSILQYLYRQEQGRQQEQRDDDERPSFDYILVTT